MEFPREPIRRTDSSILLLLFALFLLASPVMALWANAGSPWYLLYLLWAALIAMVAWASRRGGSDHDV